MDRCAATKERDCWANIRLHKTRKREIYNYPTVLKVENPGHVLTTGHSEIDFVKELRPAESIALHSVDRHVADNEANTGAPTMDCRKHRVVGMCHAITGATTFCNYR